MYTSVTVGDRLVLLTETEYDHLECLYLHQYHGGVRRQALTKYVFGADRVATKQGETRVYVHKLRKKLGKRSDGKGFIETVRTSHHGARYALRDHQAEIVFSPHIAVAA